MVGQIVCICCIVPWRTYRFIHVIFCKRKFLGKSIIHVHGSFWFITTLNGLTTIHKKNVLGHKIWMMRSYAMAMTAVTFRVYHIVFYLMGWGHLENYEL